jgi:cytochrome c553
MGMDCPTKAAKRPWVSTICVLAILSGCVLEPIPKAGVEKLTYHYNSQRTGWNDHESTLLSRSVAGPSFGLLWETPTLDYFEGVPPRLFASPLYVNSVGISAGRPKGDTFPTLYVAAQIGKQVYDQRCSMCHGVKESGAPTRETVAKLPRGEITDVLVNGLMRDIALGLSDEEINALATFLTLTETAS